MRNAASQKSVVGIEVPVGLKLRVLIVGPLADRGAAPHEQIGVRDVGAGFVQHFQQRAGEHAVAILAFPGFLNALASGQQNVTAGRDVQRLAALPQRGIVSVQIRFQRPFVVHLVRLSRPELSEVIRAAGSGTGMAAVQDHCQMGSAAGRLGDQNRQFLVGQIEAARLAAVVAHQPLVLAVGKELAELVGRLPTGAVAAVLEDDGITRAGPAQVPPEPLDHIGPSGVGVLENFDVQRIPAEGVGQIVVEMVNIVQAAIQSADRGRIVVDADKQGIDIRRHEWPHLSRRVARSLPKRRAHRTQKFHWQARPWR
jgi:hypothetical protein